MWKTLLIKSTSVTLRNNEIGSSASFVRIRRLLQSALARCLSVPVDATWTHHSNARGVDDETYHNVYTPRTKNTRTIHSHTHAGLTMTNSHSSNISRRQKGLLASTTSPNPRLGRASGRVKKLLGPTYVGPHCSDLWQSYSAW